MKSVIFIVAFFGITSCVNGVKRVDKPANLLEREKLVEVLTEMSKMEAHIQMQYGQVTMYHKSMIKTGDSILKAHNVNLKDYENSMDYYGSRQDEMLGIYNEVLDKLNKELGELQAK